jgi:hypothetical protein
LGNDRNFGVKLIRERLIFSDVQPLEVLQQILEEKLHPKVAEFLFDSCLSSRLWSSRIASGKKRCGVLLKYLISLASCSWRLPNCSSSDVVVCRLCRKERSPIDDEGIANHLFTLCTHKL